MRQPTRLSIYLLSIVLTLFIVITGFWMAAGRLLSPPRLNIQEYQLSWLNQPSQYGLRISKQPCSQNLTVCLFVSPDPALKPGARGALLRQQLHQRGNHVKPYGQTQGILLLLHGRAGRKENLLPVAERFAAIGFNCVLIDLPGHGESNITEAHFAADMEEQKMLQSALIDARNYFSDAKSPAYVWGISMGGAYAIRAAAQNPNDWQGLVVLDSFDQLQGVVQDRFAIVPALIRDSLVNGFLLAVNWRSGFRIEQADSLQLAKSIRIPTLVAHGDQDQLIKIERGKRLFEAFASPQKRWIAVSGADHDTLLITNYPLYADMGQWLLDVVATGQH